MTKNASGSLLHNDILGWVSPEFEQQAVKYGWIVKRNGRWMVARERIIASNGGQGFSYQKGDTIDIINRNYLAYKESQRNSDFRSLSQSEPESFEKRVDKLF